MKRHVKGCLCLNCAYAFAKERAGRHCRVTRAWHNTQRELIEEEAAERLLDQLEAEDEARHLMQTEH